MSSAYIVTAILIWSSLGVFVRIAGTEVHVLLFYTTCFSLIFQSFLFTKKQFRALIPQWRQFPFILLLSICLLLNTFTFLFAYAKTSVANAVLTHYIAPVVVAFLAAFFLKERITIRIILSIAIASVGLWTMLGGSTIRECFEEALLHGFRLNPDFMGIASGLLSGIFYAFLIILIRLFTQQMNPYLMVFFQNLFMALFLFPLVRVFPLEKMGLFALMGAVHSTAAPFLYYRGLRSVQASRAAVLGYLEPVGAIIFGIIFLGEHPYVRQYVGGGLIILSGYLTIREK